MAEGGRKPYDVFRTMLPRLTAALGKEPTFTNVTDFLLADGLITEQQLDSIKSKPNLSDKQRGSEVAHCLLDKIRNHDHPAKCLLQICDIFEDEDVGSEVLKKHGATMRSKIKETPEASRSDPIKAQPTVPVFSGTTASGRFRSVSDRLENAISSCLTGVVGKLYAPGLISLDLKDEMINSHDIPSKKASKLVSELQRTLNNDKHPETFLNDVCKVLRE
uniref:CARD domain-containing protein n=1 Tax=Amphimedon queenslandica TaxID=400682 RepID=A0A1X7SEU7_AMPQE